MFIVAPTKSHLSCYSGLGPRLIRFLMESDPLAENQNKKKKCETSSTFYFNDAQVSEDGKSLRVWFDVPGLKADDIQVSIANDVLTINGKHLKSADNVLSTFEKRVKLDHHKWDTAQTEAMLSDGVLTIILPTKKQTGPLKISVISKSPQEDDNDFSLCIPLPGVKVNDLNVEYMAGRIRIKGHRKVGKKSTFQRAIQVDSKTIDVMNITGYLKHGILTFVAPKRESQPKQIICIQTDAADGEDISASASGTKKKSVDIETVPTDDEAKISEDSPENESHPSEAKASA